MALIEKELQKNLLQNLAKVVENDKKRKIPVIKAMRPEVLIRLANKMRENTNTVNFIGITGESASGKSTFVKTITKKIKEIEVEKNKSLLNFISTDNYFNDISAKIKEHGSFDNFLKEENYNPDAPTSFKLDLMRKHIEALSRKEDVFIPEYKINGSGISVDNAIFVKCAPIIVSEGIAVLYQDIRDLFDIRFYVEVDDETRLKRYIKRAVEHRNQTETDAVQQYETINKSAKIYLRPQRKYADIIINGAASIEDFAEITEEINACF